MPQRLLDEALTNAVEHSVNGSHYSTVDELMRLGAAFYANPATRIRDASLVPLLVDNRAAREWYIEHDLVSPLLTGYDLQRAVLLKARRVVQAVAPDATHRDLQSAMAMCDQLDLWSTLHQEFGRRHLTLDAVVVDWRLLYCQDVALCWHRLGQVPPASLVLTRDWQTYADRTDFKYAAHLLPLAQSPALLQRCILDPSVNQMTLSGNALIAALRAGWAPQYAADSAIGREVALRAQGYCSDWPLTRAYHNYLDHPDLIDGSRACLLAWNRLHPWLGQYELDSRARRRRHHVRSRHDRLMTAIIANRHALLQPADRYDTTYQPLLLDAVRHDDVAAVQLMLQRGGQIGMVHYLVSPAMRALLLRHHVDYFGQSYVAFEIEQGRVPAILHAPAPVDRVSFARLTEAQQLALLPRLHFNQTAVLAEAIALGRLQVVRYLYRDGRHQVNWTAAFHHPDLALYLGAGKKHVLELAVTRGCVPVAQRLWPTVADRADILIRDAELLPLVLHDEPDTTRRAARLQRLFAHAIAVHSDLAVVLHRMGCQVPPGLSGPFVRDLDLLETGICSDYLYTLYSTNPFTLTPLSQRFTIHKALNRVVKTTFDWPQFLCYRRAQATLPLPAALADIVLTMAFDL